MNHNCSYIVVLFSFNLFSASPSEAYLEVEERIFQARFVVGFGKYIDLYLNETDYVVSGDKIITRYTNDMASDEPYVATALRCYLGTVNPEFTGVIQKSLILTKNHNALSKNPSGLVFTHPEVSATLMPNRVIERRPLVKSEDSTKGAEWMRSLVSAKLSGRAKTEESVPEYAKLPSGVVMSQSIWQKTGAGLRSLFKKGK